MEYFVRVDRVVRFSDTASIQMDLIFCFQLQIVVKEVKLTIGPRYLFRVIIQNRRSKSTDHQLRYN